MVAEWGDYICGETLADAIEASPTPAEMAKTVSVGEAQVTIWIVSKT